MPLLAPYDRVCLFAHYDPHDMVDDVVVHYLSRLRRHGFGIIFVSTARLGTADVDRLRETCDAVELRGNGGLDFGSWAHAWRRYGDEITGDLLLANDSVYGPIGDLQPILDRFAASQADFFGLVESTEHEHHLQSWFLLFRAHVVRSEAFSRMFSQDFEKLDKRAVIRRGEVGLTRSLQQAGFTYDTMFGPAQVCRHPELCKINPSTLLWRELLSHRDVPFVKVQVLRDNPSEEPDTSDWRRIVDALEPDLGAMIEAHLARIRRPVRNRSKLVVALVRWRNQLILPELRRAISGGAQVRFVTACLYSALRLVGLSVRRLALIASRATAR